MRNLLVDDGVIHGRSLSVAERRFIMMMVDAK